MKHSTSKKAAAYLSTTALLAMKVAADQARDAYEAELDQELAARWECRVRGGAWRDARALLDRGWTYDIRRGQQGGAAWEPPVKRAA